MRPGIHALSADEYHDDPCEQPSLSASVACILCNRSPLHAWTAHPKLNPNFERRDEDRFDIGRVAHSLLLEGLSVDEAVVTVEADDWRTNAAKEAREDARAAGKTALLAKHVDGVKAMLNATRSQLEAVNAVPPLFVDGKPEQTLIWEERGVTCRALVDWLHDDYATIDDFKTTSASANPEGWTRTLFTIGADVQTAFYRRGVEALTGIRPEMRYVVQETYPPYALSVIGVGPDVLAMANAKIEYAIARWQECLKTGKWPGYLTEIAYAELPPWEDARWASKLAIEVTEVAA